MATLRPELELLPPKLRALPVDDRGYPVPWFVAWVDGRPEFRSADGTKWAVAVRDKRCWVCGARLGKWMAFVAGPMCGINRTSSEPPCHLECAEWSARNCPFLTRPKMVRREDALINNERLQAESAGTALTRNPGVALVWVTDSYRPFKAGNGYLIRMGEPHRTIWYCEGRPATRAEVVHSIETGLPSLMELAQQQDEEDHNADAVRELERARTAFEAFYPVEESR